MAEAAPSDIHVRRYCRSLKRNTTTVMLSRQCYYIPSEPTATKYRLYLTSIGRNPHLCRRRNGMDGIPPPLP
eukprot:scaffold4721_cov52-Cyclotella_meneghiniana.AAC.3